MSISHATRSAGETRHLGMVFGSTLRRGDVIGLTGTLGSGKTQFVKGICAAFAVESEVLSPSFVLMHRYEGKDPSGDGVLIHHFDFYRIRRAEELDEMGFRDLVGGEAISVIEWADAFPEVLPPHAKRVMFEHGEGEDIRTIHLPSRTAVRV